MCSKLSSSRGSAPLCIGRVRGHRGSAGEMTVVVASGRPERWRGLDKVLLDTGPGAELEIYEVQGSRAYKDRLILKLSGVDDPGQAAGFKGRSVWVAGCDAPALPEGEYYLERLVGMTLKEDGKALGTVADILESGGTHVLVVATENGGELLIPLVREMVKEVDETESSIHVVLPKGLKELGEDSLR